MRRLAPTVCPHRHPLGGRNFESFSEDPLLAGKMASGYITGLQEKGVGATIKHFAANEQETKRFSVNAVISERVLREIYLKPFEIAIKEAKPWAVMTSYNIVNGVHADMNEFLLQKVLRGQWGWKGLVMSDWGGVNSTVESLQAGTDLEMPGPTKWRQIAAVLEAVEEGKLSAEVIDQRARNVLELLVKVKAFEDPSIPAEQAVNKPEHQALIRDAGARGIVLLKNENSILPLKTEKLTKKKVALLGLAEEALIHGGGSASVNAHYRVTPEEGLKAAFGDDVEFVYAKGKYCPPLKIASCSMAHFVEQEHTPSGSFLLSRKRWPTATANPAGQWSSSRPWTPRARQTPWQPKEIPHIFQSLWRTHGKS